MKLYNIFIFIALALAFIACETENDEPSASKIEVETLLAIDISETSAILAIKVLNLGANSQVRAGILVKEGSQEPNNNANKGLTFLF